MEEPTPQDIFVDRLAGAVMGQLLGACMSGPPPSWCGLALIATDSLLWAGRERSLDIPAVRQEMTQWANKYPLAPILQRSLTGNPGDILQAAGGSLPFNHVAVISICGGAIPNEIQSARMSNILSADTLARAGGVYCRSIIRRIMFGTPIVHTDIPDEWIDENLSKTAKVQTPGHVRGSVVAATFALACIKHAVANQRVPNFRAILQSIAGRGGDTVENCSIAGAILGAYLGFHRLPQEIIKNIIESPVDTGVLSAQKLMEVGLAMSLYGAHATSLLLETPSPNDIVNPVDYTPPTVVPEETPPVAAATEIVENISMGLPTMECASGAGECADESAELSAAVDSFTSDGGECAAESANNDPDSSADVSPTTITSNNLAIESFSATDGGECTSGAWVGAELDDLLRELATDNVDNTPGTFGALPGTPDGSAEGA